MTVISAPLSQSTKTEALNGNLGVIDIVFTVLAFNAPLTVVTNFAVLVILYGNGIGAPAAYAIAAIILCIFASCFTAMAKSVPNAGAYYAYITAGLGKPIGLSAATLAVLSYSFLLLGIYMFASVVWQNMVTRLFGINPFEWWQWAFIIWGLVCIMGYLHINMSAKVLGIALIAELLVVLVWQGVGLGNYGPAIYDVSWLSVDTITSGSIAVAILYAMTSFAGFEATAVFREESRDPERVIPAATYIAIGIMFVVFASSIVVFINMVGPDSVIAAANANIEGVVLDQFEKVLSSYGVLIVDLLLCTSTFACAIALHNVIARYIYSLAVDGVIIKDLAKVHHKFGSPHIASVFVSLCFLAGLILLIYVDFDPMKGYAVFSGFGGLGLIYLVLLTALSIFFYFLRVPAEYGVFRKFIAPFITVIVLGCISIFATINIDLMTGDKAFGYSILALVLAACVISYGYSFWLRTNRKTAFDAIGRQKT